MKALIKRTEPMYLMESIQDELNKIIKDSFGELEFPEFSMERTIKTWRPAVEMTESDGKYFLKAELPGLEKDNIEVEIREDYITIKAESKHKVEEKHENLYKSELKYGKFLRTISFPSKININEAKAEYKNGILTVEVPKIAEEKEKLTKLKID
jgi:HSP20 family protein